MASLFTNASAQTALKTLTAASNSLSATQNRVSTGYRISTAEDNAAYWSIATTLRSDVGALGAVKDALGLGAATIDTVYTGINDTKDLLDQIKSKLVTASQSGVPRSQVQTEITQLQNRLADVSKSTVINSESWLTQKSDAAGYNSTKSVVGSFTRAAGAVTIESIDIDISKTKLYENNETTKAAVKSTLNDDTGGALKEYADAFADANDVNALTTAQWGGHVTTVATAVTTGLTLPANAAAGGVHATRLGTVNGLTTTSVLTSASAATLTAFGGADEGQLVWDNLTEGAKATLVNDIKNALTTYQKALAAFVPTGATAGEYDGADLAAVNGFQTTFTGAVSAAVAKAYDEDTLKAAVSANVGETARKNYAAAAKGDAENETLGILDKVRTVISSDNGSDAKAISIKDIDIAGLTDTKFDRDVLSAYISVVDDALKDLTGAAAIIGAAKARVEGNKTFVQNLIDANNRGIGQLVDADLNEESSKLKALQVQQQLAIQALGIANSSTQNILSLFQ